MTPTMTPMTTFRHRQRGEGKVGCTISFLVLVILAAIAIKVVPAYYADNQISDVVERKAENGAGRTAEAMVKEIRTDIQSLGVPEATREGAITMTKSGDSVTAHIRYSRKIDLYGITEWPMNVDKTITRGILEGIR